MIAVGLTYRESLAIVAIAFLIVSVVISANGAIGAMYHSPFPVLARASWGFYGSYIAIISRVILAVFWFAIQTYNGSNSVTVMIGAIWPSYLRLPNHIPADQGITTNGMVSFLVFSIIQFPFLCINPNKLRWLFMAKSIIVPIAWIAILIWAFKSTGGGEIFNQKVSVTGSQYSWLWLANLTSVIGNYATLSVNQVRSAPIKVPVNEILMSVIVRLFAILPRQCQVATDVHSHAPHSLHIFCFHWRRLVLSRPGFV